MYVSDLLSWSLSRVQLYRLCSSSEQGTYVSSWAPSAALVRAMLLTGTVAVDWSYAQDGKYGTSTDESNLLIPNTKGGFGLLQLANILRATGFEKELDDCQCLEGTTFFAPDADKEFGDVLRKDIFTPNYGTSCAPWDVRLSPCLQQLLYIA